MTGGKRSLRLWSAEYLKSKGKYYVVESRNLDKPNIMITYCLTALPLTPNTWLLNDFESWFCVTLCFAPACLELWSVAFEAWLVLYLQGMLLANFNRKEHLRHRAVSLRQHGFLVVACSWDEHCLTSYSTQFRPFGRCFTGLMTQPTVSKYWLIDWLSMVLRLR